MSYKVVEYFTDLKDNCYAYAVGDIYPRQGVEADAKRIAELSTDANKRKRPLIVKVEDAATFMAEPTSEIPEADILPAKQSKKRGKKSADRNMSRDTELV